ncbi:MAG: phenylalanine--tRNA ligase subunit alpha [Bdellovibrionales bacterium]|nr:phenylalanine--tRNA ligase subunit alpha [Bdellovibrionales bacterium]
MKEKADTIFHAAKKAFLEAENSKSLYDAKVLYMGKKGEFSLILKELKNLPAEEKPKWGQKLNEIRKRLETLYLQRKQELEEQELSSQVEKDILDLSLPPPEHPSGSLHPITKVIDEIIHIFTPLGWSVQTGPLVESDWYNFTALNIPPFHPSRDLQDTFYVEEDFVLRTHTSPVQIRALQSFSPPLAVLAPGPVFRHDSDISHSPMFHQIEGLLVDKHVSFADLKGTLSFFLKKLFGPVEMRFRPSFFPFTEPSAEYDISCLFCKKRGCPVCKKSGWIEVGGCGLVHPNVFSSAGLKGNWEGFAFGLGLERLAMLLYNIPNIRLLFENDLRFLRQFENL